MSEEIALTIRVRITDRAALRVFARQRYFECWKDATWRPKNNAEALYEALIASNGTPESPVDYGIELLGWSAHVLQEATQ